MRRAQLLIIVSLVLAACRPGVGPVATADKPTEQGTRALPAEPTATSSPIPIPTIAATPTLLPAGIQAQGPALLEQYQSDTQVLRGATRYHIDVSVDFDDASSQARLQGVARIQFTNDEGEQIETLPLMLWPNDEQYRSNMSVDTAIIDGQLVAAEPELGGLAVRFQLPQALDPGDTVDMTVPFSVEAEGPIGSGSPRRFGITEGVLFAPTFYPLVPRWVGGEWEVKDAPPGGDTTNSEIASYTVAVEAPVDLDLVASGTEIDRQEIGSDRIRALYVGGPIRDFAFALGDFIQETEVVDEVEVHVWVLPSHEDDLDRVMESATEQLALLNELVGQYPYEELDLVDVPGAYGGIEYPGLVTVGTLGTSWVIEPVVHEVAHQWMYGLVGDDQIEEPWLDEAFATYATALYYEYEISSGRATGYLSDFRDILRNHPEPGRPIGLGVGEYEGRDYSLFVYLKGALFYQELRQRLGEDTFFDFLKTLYQMNRYGFINSQEFEETAEASCDCELDDLFELWVYQGGALALP